VSRPANHLGENLIEELTELGVTLTELSRQIDVPPNRLTQVHGRRRVTSDTAPRLGHWYGTSATAWPSCSSFTSSPPPSPLESKNTGPRGVSK